VVIPAIMQFVTCTCTAQTAW